MTLSPNTLVENIRANLAAIASALPGDPETVAAFVDTLRAARPVTWPQGAGIERGVRQIRMAGILTVIWSAAATLIGMGHTVMLPLEQLLAFLPFDSRPEETDAAREIHNMAVLTVELAAMPAKGTLQ